MRKNNQMVIMKIKKNPVSIYKEIKDKIERSNNLLDKINGQIKELEDLLSKSALPRIEFEVSKIWGTNVFYVYWCPKNKQIMAYTEDADKPLLAHGAAERKEFFSLWHLFLILINEAL